MAEDGLAENLRKWYTNIQLAKLDLIGDLAGKELFVIHGESLLLHCIEESKVDFVDGFQLLHAVHAVESFLCKLRDLGCNFHVLWFDDHEDLCVPAGHSDDSASKYRLSRAVLLRHLQINVGADGGVFAFPSMDCEAFKQYLRNHAVRFFMVPDGRRFPEGHDSRLVLRAMLHRISSNGYTTVLFDDVEFSSSKVYTSVLLPQSWRSGDPEIKPFASSVQVIREDSGSDEVASVSKVLKSWPSDSPKSARQVICLAFVAQTVSEHEAAHIREYCAALLVQLVVMSRCPLFARATKVLSESERAAKEARDPFLARYAVFASSVLGAWDQLPQDVTWDAFDLVDGRLFHQIRARLASSVFEEEAMRDITNLFKQVHSLTGVDLSTFVGHKTSKDTESTDSSSSQTPDSTISMQVLKFHHPVFDKLLHDVQLTESDEPDSPPSKIFDELTHWHNAKAPVDPKKSVKPQPWWMLRRNQRLMADIIRYAASLTNAAGKNITPETIVAGPATKDKTDKSSWKANLQDKQDKTNKKAGAKKGADKKSGKEKALETAQALKAEKMQEKSTAVMTFWTQRCQEFEKENDLYRRYLAVSKYIDGLSSTAAHVVLPEALLYVCNVLARLIARPGGAGVVDSLDILAMIWDKTVNLAKLSPSPEVFVCLERFAKALKLPPSILPAVQAPKVVRKLPFRDFLQDKTDLGLSLDSQDFQLTHCGPYLERSFDPTPDSRVEHFIPDAWQRKVLDAIDADNSLFVVAPTSAGKTFISFYAMKKVLQANDDDILVYVAPTKALVNQIAAEIQARFSKTYHHEARSVWSVHTPDYRINNPAGCQILVTVPHILQILLLAPSNAEKATSWSHRVKRIIFDEVHCIGSSKEGLVWEQLLLMAPCPIIALSATVGNLHDFKMWLEGTQRAKGYELETIVHDARYSDLRKFIYEPRSSFKFDGLPQHQRISVPGIDQNAPDVARFALVHPIGAVVDVKRETLHDVTLEARDCFALWRCMEKHQTKQFPVGKDLSPQKALPPLIKKADIVSWESALKSKLREWMVKPNESPFTAVRTELQQTMAHLFSAEAVANLDREHTATTLGLLVDLLDSGCLPAILFNFDRNECERTLETVLEELKAAESAWKETSPEWRKTETEYQAWLKEKEAAAAKGLKAPAKSKKRQEGDEAGSKADVQRQEASKDWSHWESFDPEAPVARFSFANHTKLTAEELAFYIDKLQWVGVKPHFIDGMKRGIAVHHDGMNRQYRQMIETLFRKGFLTVVVATGTLALGINMPCKTVVFADDSVFLTALDYRQASGRAGRRGFDLLGNVVFHAIKPQRVLELISSSLPDLRGQFAVSTTLVLRILSLLHHTGNSQYAINATESLVSQTRCYLGGPAAQMYIKHHVRFSIEYLRRQNLLSETGVPLNFSGLVSHLYFAQNSVFGFHSLLKNGYFHELCRDINTNPQKVLQDLMLVLSHIFCRLPLSRHLDKTWIESTVKQSSSIVVLPPLPPRAHELLRQHNREALDIFRRYVATYVDQHLGDAPDRELPFTKIKVGPESARPLGRAVFDSAPATALRSPFVALSGFTDTFSSIHELCSTARAGVFLEESAVPYEPVYPEETRGVPWNAYLLDYYKHGTMAVLVRDNGIRSGDVWYALKDFSMVLATIITSLQNFVDPSADGDVAMADVQDAEDRDMTKMDDHEPGATAALPVRFAAPTPAKTAPKKKKKVVDSWDDEDNDDDDDESAEGDNDSGDAFEGSTTTDPTTVSGWAGTEGGETEMPLMKVLKAFKMLQDEFDGQFRKEWA